MALTLHRQVRPCIAASEVVCCAAHSSTLRASNRRYPSRQLLLPKDTARSRKFQQDGKLVRPRHWQVATSQRVNAAAGDSDAEEQVLMRSQDEKDCRYGQSWQRMILQLPLEIATTLSKEDAHYLEKRSRHRWWRKGQFPRVPPDSLAEAHKDPPPLSLWQKVLPLGIIFFAASFNLTILQSLKDSIMVTTAGAETLPFLASLVVLPASLGFFFLYGRLVEILPSRAVYYVTIAPLVAFYALFATVLYPSHTWLHPAGLVDAAAPWIPTGLLGLVKIAQYWTFSLFYCAAELWGAVVISVLFWSLANDVCTVSEAKSIYPLVGIAANVALVCAGSFIKHVNSVLAPTSTHAMLCWLIGGLVGVSGVMMIAKAALDHWVIGPYCSLDPATASKPVARKKSRGTFSEAFGILQASPKIRNLAVLVVSYGISHRLFEFAWKSAVRNLFPTAQGYQGVLADVSIATGYATITCMLLGKAVFQYLGWGVAAAATPVAMLVSGGSFFGLSLLANANFQAFGLNTAHALAWAGVMAGAATQVIARSSKFSFFDPAKEMVYIEMSKEEKSKGKAAVDLIGSQIGKSGGAWVTQLLLLVTGSMSQSLPIISICFSVVVAMWLRSVFGLQSQLREYEESKAQQEVGKSTQQPTGVVNGVVNPGKVDTAMHDASNGTKEPSPNVSMLSNSNVSSSSADC